MKFKELVINDEFKIETEPDSVFLKDTNRLDGCINAYKTKSQKGNSFEAVTFDSDYKVIKLIKEETK